MSLTVDLADPTPIYAQLERVIRAEIATGRLGAGSRLPTVRQLAVELRINANTVAKVYSGLERAGVLSTQRGVGTFVREHAEPHAKVNARERERLLNQVTDRLLADAHAFGLDIDEVLHHLDSRRTKARVSTGVP
ncbi:MAG TPA: GntR family transcriptional regulator [Gemmatimonadaceae bacterium]|nr:GntR family transcriptional regulator [Gemmatimonadaceae bacterium]